MMTFMLVEVFMVFMHLVVKVNLIQQVHQSRLVTTWKRFDGGLQLKAAYEIKNFVALGLHYDIGVFPYFFFNRFKRG